MVVVSPHPLRAPVALLAAFLLLVATFCGRGAYALLSIASLHGSALPSASSLSMAAEPAAIASLSLLEDEDSLRERFAGKRVALYFSAGWCPMCTSFEPALQRFREAAEDSGKPIELIYVASDRSTSDAKSRAAALGMLAVPFEKAGEYKKTFGVWAGSEALAFGFGGRRSGVPAVVVLDPSDGTELAFVAAESQGAGALGNWPLDEGVW